MGEYHYKDGVGEEASALGQCAKGDVKEAVGAVTGNKALDNTRANTNNSNVGNPPRTGVVETNANIPASANSKTHYGLTGWTS